ncbi:MAG: hypothetical protein IPM23_01600 [Candidatus Melainabacteria bacterium]|nr:hypothetical protein [Candidatus Melainabacteria bacterium]
MFAMMSFIGVMSLAMVGMQLENLTVAIILLLVVIGTGVRVGMELGLSRSAMGKGSSFLLCALASVAIIAAPFIDSLSLVVLTEGIASLALGYFYV